MAERAAADSGVLGRLRLDDPEFESRLGEALAGAEKLLQDSARGADDPRIADLTGHLAAAGGKRMRPVLVLLGAEFGDPWRHGVLQAAVIAELVHLSSLYHDDVMDEAATRHGVPSANVRWGHRTAVFGGDWLLARSAQLAADLGPHALRLNAETAGRLVAGQLRELTGPAPDEDPVSHYFQVTAGKTAALLSMSLGIGALQAEAPEPYVRALTEYGEHLGAAFQIADDLLDLAAPAEATGKERGKDLLAGVPSLPVLLALADRDPGNAELRALLADGPVTDPAAHRRALELFTDAPATARAEAIMHQRLAVARDALGLLPRCTARRALDALCDFVAFRTS
ncbi:polyprenyl synthetase family protein [Streptomyces sp. NBC_00536]|uniref:polyprenyl synthetase family protein n=1 Tax=Streptomyces sp. NBC_00536 TaxID=2975769 RepID=UPI002E81391C|nr:polyprenyl synthetase family protein [Streptomyces sp. NBC_00536]WUC79134.1 polyprenyl synthetase family protein [Streptomyces sp. NBC_00536]